jgi:aminobenzoyl-glutamate utilization protein B
MPKCWTETLCSARDETVTGNRQHLFGCRAGAIVAPTAERSIVLTRQILILSVLASGFVLGQQKTTPEREASLKADLTGQIDGMKKQAQVMVDSVFSFGELGFQEFETSKYLTGILEREGFRVERGVAGIPTAFVATWGQGKPVIALGSDIDDIPQASQKPGVAYHDPMIEGAPGHGEGHNSGMPLNIVAAIAVKKVMEREHLSGTIKLWPGVAEELLGTKAYYVRAGVFKDMDVVLFCHVGNNLAVSLGPTPGNGLVSIEYNFKGESAHAAGAPWRGRSAPTAAISQTWCRPLPPYGTTTARPITITS